MKKITQAQARVIARELVKFINKHVAPWDIEEKPTIKGTMEEIKNDADGVYWWLSEYQMFNIQNDELFKDAEKILDMFRYPEYVAGPLATIA
jgi:hypothetical protein